MTLRGRPTATLAALACAAQACSLALDFDRAQLPPSPPRDGAADVARDVAEAGPDVADGAGDDVACGAGARYCPARGACAACCAHADCVTGERCCNGACCRGAACDPRCAP